VIGAARTAEELGRAFHGVPVRSSVGTDIVDTVAAGARLVVATVGAEPVADGGYGAALLLDGWTLLGRADLRATEETLRRWMTAAALVRPGGEGGQVIVVADPALPVVQALVRWDPVGRARDELAQRAEVGFPPAVRLAAVDGTPAALSSFREAAELPAGTEILGPVPLPAGVTMPGALESGAEIERLLLRVPRHDGAALGRALAVALAIRGARKAGEPLRVQVDPLNIG
jgi:primosomal protein N' (replication factor Y)